MKTKIVRCKRCKKNTLIDIASEPQQINAFTIRSYVGVQCTSPSCGWSEKTYNFTDVKTGEG